MAVFDCADGSLRPDGDDLDPALSAGEQVCPVPPPLRRMVAGLHALGPVKDVKQPTEPLLPGDWCLHAPVFGNVLAPDPDLPAGTVPAGLQSMGTLEARSNMATYSPLLFVRSTINSVGDAVRALKIARRNPNAYAYGEQNARVVLEYLEKLVRALPPSWVQAAETAMPSHWLVGMPPFEHGLTPQQVETEVMLVSRLGWQCRDSDQLVGLKSLTVKQATYLQTWGVRNSRRARHEQFVYLGLSGGGADRDKARQLQDEWQQQQQQHQQQQQQQGQEPLLQQLLQPQQQQQQQQQQLPQGQQQQQLPQGQQQQQHQQHHQDLQQHIPAGQQRQQQPIADSMVAGCRASVASALSCLWKLKWDNSFKEVFWRVLVDGLPTCLRLHMPGQSCLCGAVCPGRFHHYWECGVAQAVLASVSAELPAAWCLRVAGRPAVTLKNVWFMEPPAGDRRMHSGVWRVICLAIFNALDVGRAAVAKKYKQLAVEQRLAGGQQQQQQQQPLPPGQLLITDMLQRVALTPEQASHNARVQQRRQHEQQQQQQQQRLEDARQLEEVQRQAVARFWELMVDFVQMRVAPLAWIQSDSCPLDHPILRPNNVRLSMELAPRIGV